MSKDLTMKPLLNEKTYELSKSKNVFVFNVPTDSNKHVIAKAVKAQFDVDVLSVNTTISKGKKKRTMSLSGKRSVNAYGSRPNFKKAYVTLKAGQSLPFFESVEEEEEKQAKTQERFDKAAEKQAQKDSKGNSSDTGTKRRFLRSKKSEGK